MVSYGLQSLQSKLTGHAVIRDLQVGFEVALTAMRGLFKVFTGDTDAATATSRTSAAGQWPHVGHAVRPVVGALDAASRSTDSSAVRCLVDDEHRVRRTGGVEVLPLADLVQRPLYTRTHIPADPPTNFIIATVFRQD